jgi:hypothetical protein
MNNVRSSTRSKHKDPASGNIRSSTLNELDERSQEHPKDIEQCDSVLRLGVQRMVKLLEDFHDTIKGKESDEDRMLEWMFVAKTMDRLFLVLFGICLFVCSVSLLVGHPHYRSE